MPGMSPGLRSSTFCAFGARMRNVTRRSERTSGEMTVGPCAAPRPRPCAWAAGAGVVGAGRSCAMTDSDAISAPAISPPNRSPISRTLRIMTSICVIEIVPALPQHLKSELQLPRRVRLTADHAEGRRRDAGVGSGKLYMVERVERFDTELRLDMRPDLEVLEEGQIEIAHTIAAEDRREDRLVPERKCSRLAVHARIEGLVQPLIDGARQPRVVAVGVGLRPGAEDAPRVVSRDRQRRSGLQCRDAVELPATDERVDERRRA